MKLAPANQVHFRIHPAAVALLRSLLVLATILATVAPLRADVARQKRVLVLYSTRRDAQIAIIGDRELPRILDGGLPEGVDFYSEYIDAARFPDPEYRSTFSGFLRVKYAGQRFDLIITMSDSALEFIEQVQSELFADTPIVFVSNRSDAHAAGHSTGIIATPDFRGTLALATQLQPDVQQVFVVSGADGRDRIFERQARAQLRSLPSGLSITYLTGLPTKELADRLAHLPPRSIVYFLLVSRDGAGEYFHPLEYVDRVSAVANAPTYSWVSSAVDHGIVGGVLRSQEAETAAVGALALRILHGEHAGDIPVSSPDLNVQQVDWRQLRRWGIGEARVPIGTLVMFRELSVWDRYKTYVLGASALLLAQTALILGLLVQADKRRHAERQLQASQADLRANYERSRDLGQRLLTAQEEERARIALELHDDICQQIAVLGITLQRLTGRPKDQLSDTKRLVSEAIQCTEEVARSVRDLSHRLHPENLRLIGLVSAIGRLERELSTPDLAVTFSHESVPATLPPELTLCLFRIAQEALQNAAKHSAARSVWIHLRGTPGAIILTVADDGVGFDVSRAPRGLGLISMRERAEQVGGVLEVRSTPGDGTRLEVVVPVQVVATVPS